MFPGITGDPGQTDLNFPAVSAYNIAGDQSPHTFAEFLITSGALQITSRLLYLLLEHYRLLAEYKGLLAITNGLLVMMFGLIVEYFSGRRENGLPFYRPCAKCVSNRSLELVWFFFRLAAGWFRGLGGLWAGGVVLALMGGGLPRFPVGA